MTPGQIHLTDLQQWLDKMKATLPPNEWARAQGAVTGLQAAHKTMADEIAEYEALADLQRKREAPWISRWQQETGKTHSLPDYGEFIGWLLDKLDKR